MPGYGTRNQGRLDDGLFGQEFFGGAAGGSPRAQQQNFARGGYPGLHPQDFVQSGAGYGPGGGIPGSGGFQFMTGGSMSVSDAQGNRMSRSSSGIPMSAYQPGGAMGGAPRGGMLGFGGGGMGGMGGMGGGGGWGIYGPGGGGMDTTHGSGPGFPIGPGGGYSGSGGGGGGFMPPDFNPQGMPNVEWNKMPRRIQIGDTIVDFGDPTQLQMAMLGYYGQRGAQLAQVYGQQLQYMQNLRLGQMQAQTARMNAMNQARMQREGITMRHDNRMGAFGSIMDAFGGGPDVSMGDYPGMDFAADSNEALGENAGEYGGFMKSGTDAFGGPGGGMAGNAALGPMGAHTRAMADVTDINELRRQRFQNKLGMMQGIGGIMGSI
jgi:hypothetical protein